MVLISGIVRVEKDLDQWDSQRENGLDQWYRQGGEWS